MTLAGAFANVTRTGQPICILVADSRITLDEYRSLDGYPKLLDLAAEYAVAFAGSSLPVVAAAELSRPIIAATSHVRRQQQPARTTGLWMAVRVLASFLVPLCEGLGANGRCHVLMAGMLSSTTPGFAELEIDPPQGASVRFYRGDCGAVGLAVGNPEWTPLLNEVLRQLPKQPPDKGIHLLGSTLNYVIAHQGSNAADVGGGLGIGFLRGRSEEWPFWEWPPVRSAFGAYWRGFDSAQLAQRHPQTWLDIENLEGAVAQIESEMHGNAEASGRRPTPHFEIDLQSWLMEGGGFEYEPQIPDALR